jgi:hypothetical protein
MAETNTVNSKSEDILVPEVRIESGFLDNFKLENLQKISLMGNLLIALFGLAAGVYYFWKRLKVESERDKVNRVREHTKSLLELIDDYDKCINSSINNQALAAMGRIRRIEVGRIFTSIQHFLEANQTLIGFSETEIQDLMQFHSVIDNSKLSRGKTALGPQGSVKTDYHKALKNARQVCWKKMS